MLCVLGRNFGVLRTEACSDLEILVPISWSCGARFVELGAAAFGDFLGLRFGVFLAEIVVLGANACWFSRLRIRMSTMSTDERTFALKSSDGKIFEIDETVARMLQTVKHMIDDDCDSTYNPVPNVAAKICTPIPLSNVTFEVLEKVIEYCNAHVRFSKNTEHYEYRHGDGVSNVAKEFDEQFVKVDQDMLFDLILAANYLNIKQLLDLMCKRVADMMKGKTPEEIRELFHIVNDYTPEEEAEIRRQNSWAFDYS